MTHDIVLDNYGTRPFTGWVRGTTSRGIVGENLLFSNEQFIVWTGVPTSQVAKSLWVKSAAGIPVGTSRIDLATLQPLTTQPAVLPSVDQIIATCGIPVVTFGTIQVALGFVSVKPDGPGWAVHFRARHNIWVFDLDFFLVWGQGFSPNCTLQITNSDNTSGQLFADCSLLQLQFLNQGLPKGFVFNWDQVLGSIRFGPNQAQVWRGVIYWPEMQDQHGPEDALHMIWSPVVLFDEFHKTTLPPFKTFTELPLVYSGRAQHAQHVATMRTLAGSWVESPIGPALYPGRTGETDGHTNDGEEVGCVDTPRYLDLLVEAAIQSCGRRPDDYREHDGSEINLDLHQNLKTWAGIPHAQSGSDMLGKTSYPPHWEMPGNAAPADQQHFIMGTLAAAEQMAGLPVLQRIIRRNIVNLVTRVRQDMSARAVGWCCHAGAVLWQACLDGAMAGRLFTKQLAIAREILAECSRDATHPGYWHTVTNPSRFEGHPYVPVWEHAIAALGLAAEYEVFGWETSRNLALQAGLFTVRYGWQESPVGLLSIDSLEIATTDSTPFARKDVLNTYHQWMAAGACAVLRYGHHYAHVTTADLGKAQDIYHQERNAALSTNRPAEWLFPVTP